MVYLPTKVGQRNHRWHEEGRDPERGRVQRCTRCNVIRQHVLSAAPGEARFWDYGIPENDEGDLFWQVERPECNA